MKQIVTYILLLTTFVCFGTTTKVLRVIDGDTFETETRVKVRLIGINAPEISDIYGQEAKQNLSYLIENKIVELKSDNMSNDRDRYDRLIRYVILDGIDINKKMVSDGYAFAYLKYKFSKSEEYKQAQYEAKDLNKGIWGNNKKDKIIKKQDSSFWKDISPKTHIVASLLIVLLLYGLYTYFKK